MQSNTYDKTQLPLQTTSATPYVQLNYSFAVVNFLNFDNGLVQMFYQVSNCNTIILYRRYSIDCSKFYSYEYLYLSTGTVLCQLKLDWYDFHRQWNNTVVPVNYIEVPLSELWYPRMQLLSADEKRFVDIVDENVLTAQIYYNSAITLYVNDILQVSLSVRDLIMTSPYVKAHF